MYKVKYNKDVYDNDVVDFDTLDEAMSYAKNLGVTVEISTPSYKIVGKFGVDEVKDVKNYDGWISRKSNFS